MPTRDRSLSVHFSNTKTYSYTIFLRSLGIILLVSGSIVCIVSAVIGFLSGEADSTSSIFVCSFFVFMQGILVSYGSKDKKKYYRILKAGEVLGFCNIILVVIGFLTNLEAWNFHADNCEMCVSPLQQEKLANDTTQFHCNWFCDKKFEFWHIFLCLWLIKVGTISSMVACSVWLYFN